MYTLSHIPGTSMNSFMDAHVSTRWSMGVCLALCPTHAPISLSLQLWRSTAGNDVETTTLMMMMMMKRNQTRAHLVTSIFHLPRVGSASTTSSPRLKHVGVVTLPIGHTIHRLLQKPTAPIGGCSGFIHNCRMRRKRWVWNGRMQWLKLSEITACGRWEHDVVK